MTAKEGKKFTLMELVEQSKKPVPVIVGVFSENKLLKQYDDELLAKARGKEIKPSMTLADFNKKIEEYLNKKV